MQIAGVATGASNKTVSLSNRAECDDMPIGVCTTLNNMSNYTHCANDHAAQHNSELRKAEVEDAETTMQVSWWQTRGLRVLLVELRLSFPFLCIVY